MVKKILGIKADKFLGWTAIIGLIVLFLVLSFGGIDLADLMIRGNQWFYDNLGEFGVYIATFLISIVGNFSVIMPTPYLLSIMAVLLILPVNPIFIAIAAGLGAGIGELSAWLLGRGAAEIVDEEEVDKRIKGLRRIIKKGYGSWLVFFFAMTPLPDDVLLVVLGMEEFPLKKALIASVLGKFVMILEVVGLVFLAQNTLIGQLALYAYGLDISNGAVKSTNNPLLSTITLAITIGFTILLITVDWEKLWKRLKKKKALK